MGFQGPGYHKRSQLMLLKILVILFQCQGANYRGVIQLEIAQWKDASWGRFQDLRFIGVEKSLWGGEGQSDSQFDHGLSCGGSG